MANNEIKTEFIYILIYYIITSILLIGVILNFLYISKFGKNFMLKIFKNGILIKTISKLLLYLSILWFPISSIYIFTQLYYNKQDRLFF